MGNEKLVRWCTAAETFAKSERSACGYHSARAHCRWGDDMAGRHGGCVAQMAETHWYMEAMYSSVMAVSAA